MPSSVPVASGTQVVRALERAGFAITRVNGSHHMMRHPDGRTAVVPVHGNKDLLVGTMRGILRTVRLTPDEFRALL